MSLLTETVSPTAWASAGQCVILHGVSWETYERLLMEHEENSSTHFTYDQGTLEIMVLSAEHENHKDIIFLLISALAEELDIDIESFGSTTFRREDLARGFEPDTCFYIKTVALVKGKRRLDLRVDPPPDLVVAIDITSPSLNKFPVFAALGVAEVWRYDGAQVHILALRDNRYMAQAQSVFFPLVTGKVLTELMESSQSLKRNVWLRRVREWVQTHSKK